MNFLVVIIFIYLVGGSVTVPLPYTSLTAHNFCSAWNFYLKFLEDYEISYQSKNLGGNGYVLNISSLSKRFCMHTYG